MFTPRISFVDALRELLRVRLPVEKRKTNVSKQIETASGFVIEFNGGSRAVRVDTYAEALEECRKLGCEEIGHSGDLEDGGDRTLAWLTAADAENDAGANSHAVIRGLYDINQNEGED